MTEVVKVLVSDKLSEAGLDILRKAPGFEVDVKVGMKPDELMSVIPNYDALLIRSATKVTADVIKAATRLKLIGRAGIGVDNVDTKAASERGIVVMNTPGGNTTTTAEHAIAMMMSLSRLIPQASASVKSGKWEKKFMGMEHCGKTLGIIGIGRIGSIVVKRARGLEMKVIAFDPFINAEAAEKMGVELVSLDEVYARSDVISIHTPMTTETKRMVSTEAFKKMKKGVRIVNCARGGIIDEEALAVAIKEGKVAGAALDVLEKEPPSPDNPLLALNEVVITPHLGASTSEAQENVALAIAEQAVDYFVNGIIQNAVNVPSIDPEQLALVKPYLSLGEMMGSFAAQITEGGPTKVEITYMGELAEIDQRPITQSIIKGILEVYVGQSVNFVNAPYLAESRGVTVSVAKSSVKRNFATLVGLRVITDKRERYVEGTIFAGGQPRVVKLEDFLLEAHLEDTMLVFTNNDKPGVIGAIGTYLGQNGINIAAFELARTQMGGKAMAIVNIDSVPSPEQIAEMEKIPNVVEVRLAQL